MNYLAHIHLAHVSQTSLLGNFLGDFVKGSNLEHLPISLQNGVRLHRKIDSYTDNHPVVKSLREQFSPELRRISGVIIDIYFDHLLSIHWQNFTTQTQPLVLSEFYQQLKQQPPNISQHFASVRAGLLKHQWLQNYEDRKSCLGAYQQIEKRLNMRIKFALDGYRFMNSYHAQIEQDFLAFYPELIHYVQTVELD
ncbi:MAG: ACP phosphodiesterase [Aliiglaciecola sp.]|uniref:acyl carrier protein phosphodiesterase n=1 Tax=Aliiglaciecola sp. TaxID=1872441 RepID=UPI0032993296